jgi:hypothetical protein
VTFDAEGRTHEREAADRLVRRLQR